ncbi:MAG: AAA family ATPase [Gammaproteobacteria bacterium]|nr:AAA family ATPase [Gammaproteobacteria bacterium]
MQLDKIILSNFRCFNEGPTTVELDSDLTCLVGNNGSGKTALILALQRLFGGTRAERTIVREDFHLAPEEDYNSDKVQGRKLFIEVIFSFPELASNDINESSKLCPGFYSEFYADYEKILRMRMRLEATWNKEEYNDDVDYTLYWVTTPEQVEFGVGGENNKHAMPSRDRKKIDLIHIPAVRDVKGALNNTLKELKKILEVYSDVSADNQKEIENISNELSNKFRELESIKSTTKLLQDIWQGTYDPTLRHYQQLKLETASTDLSKIIRSIAIKLSPSENGESKDLQELSDGQISLLHFTLAIFIYEMRHKLDTGDMEGFKDFKVVNPVFTIFAFEEPENHLSPYYLSRVLRILNSKVTTNKATGIVTSHSPSVVRFVDKVEQIRYFSQENNESERHSIVKQIILPSKENTENMDEEYKYINQAVLAHPELYFSKMVILGEGASEEIIIPKLASVFDLSLDPSFVAFVKLGGRHVNHMWRLLNDLGIPYVTLVDLDLGRNQGGIERIKYIIKELKKHNNSTAYDAIYNKVNNTNLSADEIQVCARELEKDGGVLFLSFRS